MRFNEYTIISRAVEEGVAYGLTRAFKHTDNPTIEQTRETIVNAVLAALTEIAYFENGEENV